jgi:hypothetical protein
MSNHTSHSSKSEKPQPEGSSHSLRGYPGYRNRPGRSGLDPVDSDNESGFMAGVMLRRLLTGNLRTRSPLTLLIWAVLGLGCITPLLLAILGALRGDHLPYGAWILIAIAFLFGLLLLVNLVWNVLKPRKK